MSKLQLITYFAKKKLTSENFFLGFRLEVLEAIPTKYVLLRLKASHHSDRVLTLYSDIVLSVCLPHERV